jgi:2-C-methyl-D-erythritol 4-phosphate cytidylyltransferase
LDNTGMPDTASFTVSSFDFQPRFYALVPCAGVGERAGVPGPKQYHLLAGCAVVSHTLQALAQVDRLTATLVVLAPTDAAFEQHAPGFSGDRGWVARVGGSSRAQSVLNGLNELLLRGVQPHDWVLVHDAARCLIRPEWVNRLIQTCDDDEVGGLLALPVADTLKCAQVLEPVQPRSTGTVDRQHKWAAQTPQMFRMGLLRAALTHALSDPTLAATVTDEASAVEALGHHPRLVQGAFENIKLTWPDDFELAERLLKTR